MEFRALFAKKDVFQFSSHNDIKSDLGKGLGGWQHGLDSSNHHSHLKVPGFDSLPTEFVKK